MSQHITHAARCFVDVRLLFRPPTGGELDYDRRCGRLLLCVVFVHQIAPVCSGANKRARITCGALRDVDTENTAVEVRRTKFHIARRGGRIVYGRIVMPACRQVQCRYVFAPALYRSTHMRSLVLHSPGALSAF